MAQYVTKHCTEFPKLKKHQRKNSERTLKKNPFSILYYIFFPLSDINILKKIEENNNEKK